MNDTPIDSRALVGYYAEMSKSNSLFSTLVRLKGNPRACVYTEPLWGISVNLCLPYASVYMLQLGLSDKDIGVIATVYMLSQVLFAFLSGPITDKMGRRKSTAVFDFIAWCIPCLIWWRAEGFMFFFVAALINGTMRITTNSWNCLLIEDADKKQYANIYSIIIVCGQLFAIFAPISAIMVSRLTLIPAVRILYLNAFILMTIKVIILYIASRETQIGKMRMEECRHKNIFNLTGGYKGVIHIILSSRGTLFAITIAALFGIIAMINATFWSVIVNQKIMVPEAFLPLFMVLRSIVAMIFLIFIAPRLTKGLLRTPILLGFLGYLVGQTLLILVPTEGLIRYLPLCISLIFDGLGFGALMMLVEALLALHVNPDERARVMAIQHTLVVAVTAPFGWIGGMLSSVSRDLPFVLNIVLIVTGVIVTVVYYHTHSDHSAETAHHEEDK